MLFSHRQAIELINEKRSNEQKRHIKTFEEDEKLELLNGNESDGGFSVADKQYDTSFQDGTSYDEGYGIDRKSVV